MSDNHHEGTNNLPESVSERLMNQIREAVNIGISIALARLEIASQVVVSELTQTVAEIDPDDEGLNPVDIPDTEGFLQRSSQRSSALLQGYTKKLERIISQEPDEQRKEFLIQLVTISEVIWLAQREVNNLNFDIAKVAHDIQSGDYDEIYMSAFEADEIPSIAEHARNLAAVSADYQSQLPRANTQLQEAYTQLIQLIIQYNITIDVSVIKRLFD